MEIPNGGELPGDATVIFHVSGGKKIPKSGACERIDFDALKCDDDGISVTWVDHFDGNSEEQFAMAARSLCGNITVRKSGVIASIKVSEILEAMADEPNQITIVRDKLDENEGHCLIKGISPDEAGALAVLADAVRNFTPVTDVQGLVNG